MMLLAKSLYMSRLMCGQRGRRGIYIAYRTGRDVLRIKLLLNYCQQGPMQNYGFRLYDSDVAALIP